MTLKKILIIEDDKPIQDTLKTVLEIEGYSVQTANHGKEALEVLSKSEKPSIILLDMMMPVMNGWEFLDVCRSNRDYSKIPVVVVSAFVETARSVKTAAYIPKPIRLERLLNVIEKCAA